MGLSYSRTEQLEDTDCLICWDPIDSIELVFCTRCNIQLHKYCEETHRGEKGFCKCPHCQQLGSLGSLKIYKNK